MSRPDLRADCTRCSGLCCVALSFDRSPDFAVDKPAGTPCQHLSDHNRCRIHARLDAEGFSGCRRYDCLGAGQRVTQEIFPGRSWRDSPATARAMFEAFRILRSIHGLLALLQTAPASLERDELLGQLDPEAGWTYAGLLLFDGPAARAKARAVVRCLPPQLPPRGA